MVLDLDSVRLASCATRSTDHHDDVGDVLSAAMLPVKLVKGVDEPCLLIWCRRGAG